MENVYDLAHGLARALKESEQYRHYLEMKTRISENEDLSNMINDFQAKNMDLQTQQMLGGVPPEELVSQVQALYQIVMADPLAAQYFQAEIAFTQVVSDIYGILGEVIRVE
jgi:cell fate (sporulation/competence/biofilm development) regulator YlbF (YheA/YmcA/DUF963 family)